jgi:hypothetical protein
MNCYDFFFLLVRERAQLRKRNNGQSLDELTKKRS